MPWGCGIASLLFLVLLFAGGYAAANGGMQRFVAWVIDNSEKEIEPLLTKDVPPALRATLAAETHRAAENIRSGRVPTEKGSQLLQVLRDTAGDRSVNATEVNQILREVRAINEAAGKRR